MRGPQLGRSARGGPPELRVLLVSGYTEQALDRVPPGAAFPAKPFRPGTLLEAVAGLIEGAQAAQARASRPPEEPPLTTANAPQAPGPYHAAPRGSRASEDVCVDLSGIADVQRPRRRRPWEAGIEPHRQRARHHRRYQGRHGPPRMEVPPLGGADRVVSRIVRCRRSRDRRERA
jgi:hypothetical protein